MKAAYSDREKTTIAVTLDDGDVLGDLVGPTVAAVPVDVPSNRESADLAVLIEGGLTVAPWAPPYASPSAVSDRQFFQALADAGTITQAEALAAVRTGDLPAGIEAAVKALPDGQQFAARMLLSGATTFERGHPMVAQLGSGLGYDDKALDALWTAAAAL